MKVELTKEWDDGMYASYARWRRVVLSVGRERAHGSLGGWEASVWICAGGLRLSGSAKRTRQAAKRDAERLAPIFMLGIRDSVRDLMIEHGIEPEPQTPDGKD